MFSATYPSGLRAFPRPLSSYLDSRIQDIAFYMSLEKDGPIGSTETQFTELTSLKSPLGKILPGVIKDSVSGEMITYESQLFYITATQNINYDDFLDNMLQVSEENGIYLRYFIVILCKKLLDKIEEPDFDRFKITIFAPRNQDSLSCPKFGEPQNFEFYLRDLDRMMAIIPEDYHDLVEF